MTRKSTPELIREAGFAPGEFDQSRHFRGRICDGSATPEDQLAYQPFAAKWSRYAELLAERDQADAHQAAAPDPARHDADPNGGLGEAMAQYRAGKPPPMTVVRPRLIQVDVSGGRGAMMDIPEASEWPVFVGSAGSGGLQRIAASLAAGKKR